METKKIELEQVLNILDKMEQKFVTTPDCPIEVAESCDTAHDSARCWMMHNATLKFCREALLAATEEEE